MTRRSWGLLLLQEDGPGLYILTRTRQESDLLLFFCTQFFETWGFESCKRTVQRCRDVHIFFFPSGQPLYRQVLRTWIQMMMNWLMNWMKAWIYRLDRRCRYQHLPRGCQLVKPKGMVNWHPLRNHLIWYLWKVQVCSLWFIMIYHIWYVFIVCISH